jgi:hypothetical protein
MVLSLLWCAPAFAQFYPDAGTKYRTGAITQPAFEDRRVYKIYDGTIYDDTFKNMVREFRQENARWDGRGIKIVVVEDKSLADTIVIDVYAVEPLGWCGLYQQQGATTPAIIRFNTNLCMDGRSQAVKDHIGVHEMGHSFTWPHTGDKTIDSVMSPNRPRQYELGSYDKKLYYQQYVKGR